MYDPATGTWASQDPIGFEGDASNLFRYVENQSTSFVDPTGLVKYSDGHHFVPYEIWKALSEDVAAVFDDNSDKTLPARIRDDVYNFHDGSTINGVSHDCYNAEVRKELSKFLGGKDISTMTPEQAKQFLRQIHRTNNKIISDFNKGVLAEAHLAKKLGEAKYRELLKKKVAQKKAFNKARDFAEETVKAARPKIAQLAGKKAARLAGKAAHLIPLAGVVGTFCATGDLNAAGREALLELTGADNARDAGELLGIYFDTTVEQVNESADSIGGGRRWMRNSGSREDSSPNRRINRHGIDIDF